MSKHIKIATPAFDAFCARFGPIGKELAVGLPMFALDLVGEVTSYATCGLVKPGAEASLLFTFQTDHDYLQDIASSPDGNVWISDGRRISVYDEMGRVQVNPLSDELIHPSYVAVDAGSGEVLVMCSTCLCVFDFQGRFLRAFSTKVDDMDVWHSDTQALAVDGRGYVFTSAVCAEVQVRKRNGDLVRVISLTPELKANGIPVSSEMCALSTPGDIAVFSPGEVRTYHFSEGGATTAGTVRVPKANIHNWSTGFALDRADNMFLFGVGSGDGSTLCVLNQEGHQITSFPVTKDVRAICIDAENKIWVAEMLGKIEVYGFAL
jgi:hypothetical protein